MRGTLENTNHELFWTILYYYFFNNIDLRMYIETIDSIALTR